MTTDNKALADEPRDDVAGYVDPEQLADMQKRGGSVAVGTYSERYGRTVAVYSRPQARPDAGEVVEKPCKECGGLVHVWANDDAPICLGCHADTHPTPAPEVTRLVEAARPFDALFQPDNVGHMEPSQPDKQGIFGVNGAAVTLGDLRRLREALAPFTAEKAALDAAIAALSQRPVVDETAWRDAFIAERARRYRSEGMKVEQARIHAETDAQVIAANALAPQQPEKGEE